VLGLALAIVLVVILGAGWAFTRTQWYVAESDGRVALFHGVQSRPLGIPLSSVEQTYFPTSCLPPIDQGRVRNGYVADGRADAQRFVDALRAAPSAPAPSPRLPPEARTGTQRPVAPTASAAPAPGTAISSECTAVTR
jgi:protein phosphatase